MRKIALTVFLAALSCAHEPNQTVIKKIYSGDTIINNVHDVGSHDPVFRSVVNILNIKKRYRGSAFVVKNLNDDSYALTAQHLCLKKGTKFLIHPTPNEDNSREEYYAKAVYVDEENDVCLIKIYDTKKGFVEMKFSDVAPKIGERVMTIGSSVGVFPTKSDGYVIGYDLLGEESVPRQEGEPAKRLMTSLPVAGGNSGGPVYNNNFEVVGMLVGVHPEYNHSSMSIHVETLKVHFDKYFSENKNGK
ncbi:MAG: hypothetical protein CMI54_07600 [Parcubacteria group bacterium]|nr:hypothetical protein [Parcubacteria group bacterium]|tara:strand:+ start:4704 stop:5444 length:741 start_codon:yes stop_codon:yes gene_type:complete